MVTKNNGSPENIGAQISASDHTPSDMLESRPVLRFDQDFLTHPFGDSLLPQGGTLEELREPLGQGGLATGNHNGALQGSNVRFIHDHPRYTTPVVRVNNPGRVTGHNGGCTVLPMSPRRSNTAAAPAKAPGKIRVRQADLGPDGKTLGERVRACMIVRARQLGVDPAKYTQEELIAEASRVTGRNLQAGDKPIMTQQALSLILKNKVSESHASIAFAMVFGVEPAWLQYGIGPQSYLNRLLNST
jgi:hypothetical protein